MKPILFNTEMVRAILEDRKTVTRRIVKLPSYIKKQENGLFTLSTEGTAYDNQSIDQIELYLNKPYKVNDILYVRETFRKSQNGCYHYKADWEKDGIDFIGKWKPSLHMPKEAARIFLKVKDVRVERLQDMTFEDCLNEGAFVYLSADGYFDRNIIEPEAKKKFGVLWNSTIKKADIDLYGWDANPYVWVIEFERLPYSRIEELESGSSQEV